MRSFFTSESVTEGHPDKIADQISDAILDEIIAKDKDCRVACETMVTTGLVFVTGEITTKCYVDIPNLARSVVRDIGYVRAKYGFDCETCSVLTAIESQSPDIALGVDQALERKLGNEDAFALIGAGDQGMVFGYACNETPEFLPLPISLAHKLTRRLSALRKSGDLPFARPDGKSQVTVEYADGKPLRIDTVVLSTQHSPDIEIEDLRRAIINQVILPTLPSDLIDKNTRYLVNPTGRFVTGGPQGDSGLTGRKIIVDTYGGMAKHGGGAFSGKDPTKVDRSGAYLARYIAKNLVAAGLADKCEVQIAYAIGVAEPVSLLVESFGTGKISDEQLAILVRQHFDMRPAAIIASFDLLRPIYRQIASYGHFGRPELALPWEETDKAQLLSTYSRNSA
ncbi:MAG: methionine adenosyltransferase [Clostridiales bacterium]|jgi:S-adenosylmethionine synthetase|nr:methionine adenosyltransferase [Clostridiales bacterium]